MLHRHVDTVADELAIRRLVSQYTDGVNQRDAHAWAEVWSGDDARWDLAGHIHRGRDEIVARWTEALASYRTVFQLTTDGIVTLDGDHATGRWYVTERNVRRDDSVAQLWGYYDDRYVRTAAGWRLHTRVLHVIDHTSH